MRRQHGIPSRPWRGCSHLGMRVTQPSRPMTIIRLPVIQAEAAELRHGGGTEMHMTVEAYLAGRASTGSSRPHSGDRTREER